MDFFWVGGAGGGGLVVGGGGVSGDIATGGYIDSKGLLAARIQRQQQHLITPHPHSRTRYIAQLRVNHGRLKTAYRTYYLRYSYGHGDIRRGRGGIYIFEVADRSQQISKTEPAPTYPQPSLLDQSLTLASRKVVCSNDITFFIPILLPLILYNPVYVTPH
jgi:hypothetical protein